MTKAEGDEWFLFLFFSLSYPNHVSPPPVLKTSPSCPSLSVCPVPTAQAKSSKTKVHAAMLLCAENPVLSQNAMPGYTGVMGRRAGSVEAGSPITTKAAGRLTRKTTSPPNMCRKRLNNGGRLGGRWGWHGRRVLGWEGVGREGMGW